MEKLMEILNELRPDIDFTTEKSLVTDGLFDSFDMISLVGELEDEFDIQIRPNNLTPANFDSAQAIMNLIEELQ